MHNKKPNNTSTEFWKSWWDDRARNGRSDSEIDRGIQKPVMEVERHAEAQFLESVSPNKGDLLLDAGCGTGINILRFSPLVARIVAVDFSEEVLKRARHRVEAVHITNAELLTADITRLDFRDSTFDKVLCTSVLQYLNEEECRTALGELLRVCKPNGRLIIHLKNSTSLYGLSLKVFKPIAKLLGRKVTPDYYRPRRWYERTLKKHDGQILDYDSFGILTFVPMPSSLSRFLLAVEAKLVHSKSLKRFGVNYKMTVVRGAKSPKR